MKPPEPTTAALSVFRRRWVLFACVGLLAGFYLLGWLGIRLKAATYDEVLHAAAGYTIATTHDYRVDLEDPPLAPLWAALPNLVRPPVRVTTEAPTWAEMLVNHHQEWVFCRDMMYRTPGNAPDAYLARARLMMLLLGVAAGAAIAWWGWRLGGGVAAVVAVGLFALDPNFLAHSALVKNDVPFTFALVGAALCLWLLGRRVTVPRLLAGGLLCGLLLVTKFSGVIVAPLVLGLMGLRVIWREPWAVLRWTLPHRWQKLLAAAAVSVALGALAYGVLWAAYGFRYRTTATGPSVNREYYVHLVWRNRLVQRGQEVKEEDYPAWRQQLRWTSPPAWLMTQIDDRRLLPEAWTCGFLYTYASAMLRSTFLTGQYSFTGWRYYFPLAMLFKTPTATLAAVLAGAPAVLLLLARRRASGDVRGTDARGKHAKPPAVSARSGLTAWEILCLGVPFVLYGATSLTSKLNIGLRHVLPLYPFLFLAVGLVAAAAHRRWPRAATVTLAALGLGLAAETLAACPDFLAFFNTPSGGARGGLRLLSDSNLDWGQDLPRVVEWRRRHPEGTLYYGYFGAADPRHYAFDHYDLPFSSVPARITPSPDTVPSPIYYAVHATLLQGVYLQFDPRLEQERQMYRELREKHRPIRVLGGTVYIYRIR